MVFESGEQDNKLHLFLLQQVKSSKFAAQFEWKKSQCTPSFYVTQWFNFGRWGYRKWWRPQKIHSGCKKSFISQRSYSVLGSREDQHLSRNYSKTLIWFMFRSSHIFVFWFLVFWSIKLSDFISVFFRLAHLALQNVNKDYVIFLYFSNFVNKTDQKRKMGWTKHKSQFKFFTHNNS